MVEMDEPGPMGTTTFAYDALSRVTSVTDPNGTTLDYGYDRLDRVVSISSGGELIQSTSFDGNGRTTATHTTQATLTHTYDGRGDLLETVRTDSLGEETTTYAYDAAGNLTELTEHGTTTAYAYDAAFRLTEITDYTGATTAFDYDDADRRTGTTHPDGATQTKGYDDSGRLTSIEATNSDGTTVTEAAYSYTTADGDDSDQLQSKTVDGTEETYTYDALDRLTSDGTRDYTYDDAGNLLTSGEDAFTYNDADQATTARGTELGHDAAGDLTTRGGAQLEYSPTHQFLQADTEDGRLQTSVSYDTSDPTQLRGITDIDPDGQRVDRQVVNTALGISDIAAGGNRTHYVRDPDGELVAMIHRDGDQRFHYTTDHQNTVLAVTADGSTAADPQVAYTYTPYGQTDTETAGDAGALAAGLNPFTYTGAYQFANGDVHLGHRFYSPYLNQFTQPDPSRQEDNNYTYAQCDPINNTDPTGLDTLGGAIRDGAGTGGAIGGSLGCIGGGAIGAVTGAPAFGYGAIGGAVIGCVGGFAVGTALGTTVGTISGAVSYYV